MQSSRAWSWVASLTLLESMSFALAQTPTPTPAPDKVQKTTIKEVYKDATKITEKKNGNTVVTDRQHSVEKTTESVPGSGSNQSLKFYPAAKNLKQVVLFPDNRGLFYFGFDDPAAVETIDLDPFSAVRSSASASKVEAPSKQSSRCRST